MKKEGYSISNLQVLESGEDGLLDDGFDGFDGFGGETVLARHRRVAAEETHKEANEQHNNEKEGGRADPIARSI